MVTQAAHSSMRMGVPRGGERAPHQNSTKVKLRGDKGSQIAHTHLPYLPDGLVVMNESPLVDESLAIRLGTARTDPGYLVFDIADRRLASCLDEEGARIGRQFYADVHCRTLGRH